MWVVVQAFENAQLVADDDGQRALMCSLEVPEHVWLQSAPQGVVLIVSPEGGGWWACSAEEFWEKHTEDTVRKVYVAPKLHQFSSMPTWREFRAAVKAEEAARPRDHFVNLHTHSMFSALDGLSTLDEIAEAEVVLGQEHMCVTDHGVCAGHYHLMKAAKKAGLHAIYGIEGYFVYDRAVKVDQYDYMHIVLLAQTSAGLHNLWALSTDANRPDAFYGKPRMDWEHLEQYAEGLICTTACIRGPLSQPLVKNRPNEVTENLGRLLNIFGPRLYIELASTTTPEQMAVNRALVELAFTHSVPVVAAVDSHYPLASDYETHQIWLGAQTHTTGTDVEAKLFGDGMPYHLASRAEVETRLSYLSPQVVQEALDTTVEIAESCTAEFPVRAEMPMFNPKLGRAYAIDRCFDLMKANWAKVQGKPVPEAEYLDRVEFEMNMLVPKNFIDNFMITADYVREAKRQGILVGPGRGSSAGSLVAYLTDITEIDPLEYDLPFSRFMTPGRVEPPDFDVDFPTSARPWAQHYVTQRWGAEHVARVGTHGHLKNKQVVRDVTRVLVGSPDEVDFRDMETIVKVIDAEEASSAGLGFPWETVMKANEDILAPYMAKYPKLFAMCEKLVGRLKSYGRHAAGLVISTAEPLTGRLPMRAGDGDQMVSEFDYESSEAMGLLKFDFLTLRTLDTADVTIKAIEKNYGIKVRFYGWGPEYGDPLVWSEVSAGNTLGIFQAETRPMTRLIRQIKPTKIVDMADIQTLVRPGPSRSGITRTYIMRKDGLEPVTYADPRLEHVLKPTYGLIIYQEQLMSTCRVLAGYDDLEADYVRKILGKKKRDAVVEAGVKFTKAAIERGMTEGAVTALWDQMGEFAKYCLVGGTKVHLAGTGSHTDGTVTVEKLYRRIHSKLPAYSTPGVSDGTPGHPRSSFGGPCTCCGDYAPKYVSGYCQNKCEAWLQKFRHKGVYGLAYYADNRIRPARILDVVETGVQRVWRVTLADGKTITSTWDHRHLARFFGPGGPGGWTTGFRETCDLHVGDFLLVDGGYEATTPEENQKRTRFGNAPRQRIGSVNGVFGEDNYGFTDGSFTVWDKWRREHPRVCAQCGATPDETVIDIAHLDGDHQHNVPENYAWLCRSCHFAYDYAHNSRRRRYEKGHLVHESQIVSIEYAGEEMTYDVVMDVPHNFVANGIVTHNCFNKSHSVSYSVLTYWTAWLKVHYPAEYLTALLSTVPKEDIPKFASEARRHGYKVFPPDINLSADTFVTTGTSIRYGLGNIKGVGPAAVASILAQRPYASFEDFRAKMKSVPSNPCNVGPIKVLAAVGAFDGLVESRRRLEAQLAQESTGEDAICIDKVEVLNGYGLPCAFDWENEPVELTKTGKPKARTIPKKCWKACRNYRPRGLQLPDIPYTPNEIMNRELQYLGVWLTYTPFDQIPQEDRDQLYVAEEIETGATGWYNTAGLITGVKRTKVHATGEAMGIVTFTAFTADIEVAVFPDAWAKYSGVLKPNTLCFLEVRKNDKGLSSSVIVPV